MNARLVACLIGAHLLVASGQTRAQGLRDPTLPPGGRAAVIGTLPADTNVTLDLSQLMIVVRNGRPHLWLDTELYSVGQNLGEARIEHISETEVWLREKGVLRKIKLFPDIQRPPLLPAETLPHPVDSIEAQSPPTP